MITRIKYTRPFLKATNSRYIDDFHAKLERTLAMFPELDADRIEVGVTTSSTANAHTQLTDRIKIGYNPLEELSCFVLGHELTHFVQCISDIPHGEKSCDIWTVARDRLFLDRPPGYLRIPRAVRDAWDVHADAVRALCIEAIDQRANGRRRYIVWLEREIAKLEDG